MVTAELAAALPTFALLLVTAVWGIGLASAQLRCTDAAREAARAAARGEDTATIRDLALAVAPDGAEVTIDRSSSMVTVEVQAAPSASLPFGSLFSPTLSGRAVALAERA